MIAYQYSNSNKNVKNAVTYFGLTEENYREVAMDIFVKSLYTFNTLTNLLLNKAEDED
jgi:hypothetical protein